MKQFDVPVVLVLGMCFFAGGLRFSEQGFGQSKHCLVPRYQLRTVDTLII